jgi:gluconolactonase
VRRFLAISALLASLSTAANITVQEVASGFGGGEGPVWVAKGYLLFSDTREEKIYKLVPGEKPSVFREGSNGANGNAVDRQGRLYTCEYKSRRVTRTDGKGEITTLADRFEGKRLNAPNDIVVRRDGHAYFTDPLFTPLEQRELDFYGVYHIAPSGQLSLVAKSQTRPNGIALSPSGRILYVANTDEKNVKAYDVDRAGGTSNERILIRDLPGGPDGLKTDSKGNLYVTSAGIQIYTSGGAHVGTIEVPGGARNLAFGDRDFKTLYITGRTTLYRARVAVKGARP